MRPDSPVLLAQKRIGVKLVGMHSPVTIILHTLFRHWMVHADRDLWEYVVLLNRDEYVVGRDLSSGRGFGGLAEVAEYTFAGCKP